MSSIASFLGSLHQGRRTAVLAPMSGVSDLGFRRAAQDFGAALVVSEMVDSDHLLNGDIESRIRSEGEGIACHVVQLAGCRADRLAEAARVLEAEGVAAIDINMGCPAKKVVGGHAGSALMRDLDLATALIRSVVGAVDLPVTLKMRLGWDHTSINAPALARRAEAEGVALVSVHARTRCQFYQGRADWAAIRDVVDAVAIPVVANGDCESVDDALAMLDQSGAAAIMVGRAAVGRPWLVGDIATALTGETARPSPSLSRRADAALQHYASLIDRLGAEHGVRHARKHLAAYSRHAGHPVGTPLHHALVTERDPDEVVSLLASLFDPATGRANPAARQHLPAAA